MSAQDLNVLYKSANEDYRSERYKEALEKYTRILQTGNFSPELHYNMGNAWYRLKDMPNAILHYEKAIKLDPSMEDAIFNLGIANKRITDKMPALPEFVLKRYWKTLIRAKSPDDWAWLSVQLLILTVLTFGFYRVVQRNKPRKLAAIAGTALLFFTLLTVYFAYRQKNHLLGENHAIIFEPSVNVMSAPGATGSRLFVIHEGLKVEITGKNNEWTEIKLPGGDKGWIQNDTFQII